MKAGYRGNNKKPNPKGSEMKGCELTEAQKRERLAAIYRELAQGFEKLAQNFDQPATMIEMIGIADAVQTHNLRATELMKESSAVFYALGADFIVGRNEVQTPFLRGRH